MGLHVIDHPLAGDALARLRDAETPTAAFRAAVARITVHLFHEATVDLPVEAGSVRTPLGEAAARRVRPGLLTLVPILRAGLGMAEMRVLCIVAAPEGIRAVREAHPEVEIYTSAVDDGLDARHYIVPGLGDAGDRTFGTVAP